MTDKETEQDILFHYKKEIEWLKQEKKILEETIKKLTKGNKNGIKKTY